MSNANRREFLQRSSMGVAGAATMAWAHTAHAKGANSQINVGVIGCGGRGSSVAETYYAQENVKVTHVCDPDQGRLARAAEKLSIPSRQAVQDMRRLLDDPDLDAVYIATPDHWHAPAAILACDAGKHVYVEKVCSHNVREGRLLVEAARRNRRVVQHGTQCRSTPMMIEAIQMLREGAIGDVLVCRAWNIQKRANIGHQQPTDPPPGFDYDTWVGPAPMVPYQKNCVNAWARWYNFGTGGSGGDGVHDIDYARWGLGVETQPTKVSAAGGKYFFDDDQQFCDTQMVSFEYPGDGQPGNQRMLVYEQRLWATNYPSVYNCDSGVEYYGTNGRMFLSRRGKIQLLDARNRRQETGITTQSQSTEHHIADFLDAIRNDRRPNAEIEIGHLTASLCHLANLATRLGRSLQLDPQTEQVIGDEEANALMGRDYRDHWGTPKIG